MAFSIVGAGKGGCLMDRGDLWEVCLHEAASPANDCGCAGECCVDDEEDEFTIALVLQLWEIVRQCPDNTLSQVALEAGYFLCHELGYYEVARGALHPLGQFCEMPRLTSTLEAAVAFGVITMTERQGLVWVCAADGLPRWANGVVQTCGSHRFWRYVGRMDWWVVYALAQYVYHTRYCRDICGHRANKMLRTSTKALSRHWAFVRKTYGRRPLLSLVR